LKVFKITLFIVLLWFFCLPAAAGADNENDPCRETVEILQELAAKTPNLKICFYGKSGLGQKLPLAIVADPPVLSPARNKGKMTVLITSQVHGNEPYSSKRTPGVAMPPDRCSHSCLLSQTLHP